MFMVFASLNPGFLGGSGWMLAHPLFLEKSCMQRQSVSLWHVFSFITTIFSNDAFLFLASSRSLARVSRSQELGLHLLTAMNLRKDNIWRVLNHDLPPTPPNDMVAGPGGKLLLPPQAREIAAARGESGRWVSRRTPPS